MIIFTLCHRCGVLMENGRCPNCYEMDERARAMFIDLERIYQKHERLWQRLAEYEPEPEPHVTDGRQMQK